VLRLKGADFQVDGDEAAQTAMKKQEINEIFLPTDFQPVLAADEGEGPAHLRQEAAEVLDDGAFQLALGVFFGQIEEIKGVFILHGQHGLVPDLGSERLAETGLVEEVFLVALVIDLVLEDGLGPAKTGGGAEVELALEVVFAAVHDDYVFGPANFCNQWLQNWPVAVFCVKLAHAPKISS